MKGLTFKEVLDFVRGRCLEIVLGCLLLGTLVYITVLRSRIERSEKALSIEIVEHQADKKELTNQNKMLGYEKELLQNRITRDSLFIRQFRLSGNDQQRAIRAIIKPK